MSVCLSSLYAAQERKLPTIEQFSHEFVGKRSRYMTYTITVALRLQHITVRRDSEAAGRAEVEDPRVLFRF